MYYNGQGVKKDYHNAKELFEKLAEQNHAGAQFFLGNMYTEGLGVRQDLSIAKEWFGKSCDNGEEGGCNNYKILNERGIK